jgi:hypothetical protein
MTGTLPDELSYFKDTLTELNIGGGSLGGTIPSYLGEFSKLWGLAVNDNCMTGTIPEGLSSSSSITVFLSYNNNNQLSGSLEGFCDPDQPAPAFREGPVAVFVDDETECSCCMTCKPEIFECYDPYNNVSFPIITTFSQFSFDPSYNIKQYQKQCITAGERQFFEETCPCILNLGNTTEDPTVMIGHCNDCSDPAARPSFGN